MDPVHLNPEPEKEEKADNFREFLSSYMADMSHDGSCTVSCLPRDEYESILSRLKELKSTPMKKVARDYRLMSQYEIVTRVSDGTKVDEMLRKPGTDLLYISQCELLHPSQETRWI